MRAIDPLTTSTCDQEDAHSSATLDPLSAGTPPAGLHPLVAELSASLNDRQHATIGSFARQVQALHAELLLMEPHIDTLASAIAGNSGVDGEAMFGQRPSDDDVGALSNFLAQ